jgi:hypothetical protein
MCNYYNITMPQYIHNNWVWNMTCANGTFCQVNPVHWQESTPGTLNCCCGNTVPKNTSNSGSRLSLGVLLVIILGPLLVLITAMVGVIIAKDRYNKRNKKFKKFDPPRIKEKKTTDVDIQEEEPKYVPPPKHVKDNPFD